MNNNEYQYWDARAARYESSLTAVVGSQTISQSRDWLLKHLQPTDNVLELGCGTGMYTAIMAPRVTALTATDQAPDMLRLTGERLAASGHAWVQAEDCCRTSFAGESFDLVLMANLVHVLDHPQRALAEALRVLKPEGRLLLIDATSQGMSRRAGLAMGLRYLRHFGLPPRQNRSLNIEQMQNLVSAAGFAAVEADLLGVESRMICLLGRKL